MPHFSMVRISATLLLMAGCQGVEDDASLAAQALGEPQMRIGVVPAASSVSIGSKGAFVIRSKASGATLFTGTNATAVVTLGSGSSTTSGYRVQVTCGNAANVASRKAAAEAAGYPTYTEFVPTANCTRLYIGLLPATATTAQRTALKNELVAKGLAAADALVKLVSITVGTTVFRVQLGATSRDSDSAVVLSATGSPVIINGATYRGQAEVTRNSAGTLAGVNELPLEEYLYGVVPRELGPIAWPYLEAHKAQAVAARSYAIRGIGKRATDGYDLLATTADQVYGGLSAEHPLSSEAVDATRGIVPTWGGKPIDALYFSTSGGYTANNEDVFSSAPVASLRGVIDSERGNSPVVLDEIRHPLPLALNGQKNGDFEGGQSQYHRWSFSWTMDQMSEVITDYARSLPAGFSGTSVGKILSIDVLERSSSGRVKTIQYVTESGTFTDSKDHVRSSLRYFNDAGVKTNLLSTLFEIEPDQGHPKKELIGFTAVGGGFGHGVGMCQTGAAGMASRGYTYDQILHHYYQEIALTTWY
jgi:stage II sporulation protein D